MGEALTHLKRGLGDRAVILFTRTVRGKGVLGLLGRQVVEIGAVHGADVQRLRPSGAASASTGAERAAPIPKGRSRQTVSFAGANHHLQRAYGQMTTSNGSPSRVCPDDISRLSRELSAVREAVERTIRDTCAADVSDLPAPLVEIYLDLVQNDLCRRTAARTMREVASEITAAGLPEPLTLREMVTRRLARLVNTAGPISVAPAGRPYVVALVGPTGVGKTTTVAKLAGDFSICRGRKVGLITVDTYRIAAVQQLKTIADIVKVPLRTVLTTEELQAALADYRDRELVIIDTAGRGQRDAFKMNELRSFIQAARPDETHLVLAATARPHNLREVVKRFRPVGVNRLVLSKIDEAEGIGGAFSTVAESNLPVSYVTNGQDIPEDIEVADSLGLARMLTSSRSFGSDVAQTGVPAGEGEGEVRS